jgi:hypothetical protein
MASSLVVLDMRESAGAIDVIAVAKSPDRMDGVVERWRESS